MLQDFNQVTFDKRSHYGDNKTIRDFQRLKGRRRRRGRTHGIFRAVQLLCVTPRWWKQAITRLPNLTDAHHGANPYINDGLWVMVCQHYTIAGLLMVMQAVFTWRHLL